VSGRFAELAAQLSNCHRGSGPDASGGDLGWLVEADCAPGFAREVFGHSEVGVLPRLVHSRFGLNVVEVMQRAQAAQATANSNTNACDAIKPFYWDIGDATATLASGSGGNFTTTAAAATSMPVASAACSRPRAPPAAGCAAIQVASLKPICPAAS
jgi:hypothetical protein